MTVRSVHWHEGMFLWPQQMQQAEHFFAHQLHVSGTWDTHYNWGLRALKFDLDALGNHSFLVQSLRARMRAGVLVCIPEDIAVPALDFKAALEDKPSVTIYLALPSLRSGKANARERAAAQPAAVAAKSSADDGGAIRYLVDTQEVEDENVGADSQPIQVRQGNVRLMLSTEDLAGFEVLELARINRPVQAGGPPDLDSTYIPPLLACDAWKPLHADILQVVYDRFGRKITKLAAQMVTRGISFDTRNKGDAQLVTQLHNLNEAFAYLRVLAFAEGIHPLQGYLELCRLCGNLAIFNKTNPAAPTLPLYDHDDLGGCFYKVKQYLDSIETDIAEPNYEERPFIGEDQRMQVDLEQKWLEPIWEMYVGVQSPLKAEDCVRLMTKSGQLDTKIGSAARVEDLFSFGSAGLKFTHSPTPPRALPAPGDIVYFQVSRESQQEEWQHVQKSKTLAMRLNRQRIEGTIQGQRALTIKTGTSGQKTTMQFTLYLVPKESGT